MCRKGGSGWTAARIGAGGGLTRAASLAHLPANRDYIAQRRAEGKNDPEIRRCLKRYIARELYRCLNTAMAA